MKTWRQQASGLSRSDFEMAGYPQQSGYPDRCGFCRFS